MANSIFIRCSEDTWKLANKIAEKDSRSLNKQVIHLIHQEAERRGIVLTEADNQPEEVQEEFGIEEYNPDTVVQPMTDSTKSPLERLSEITKPD
jgi:hypothetical protein